jgi:hypothetical protein
MLLIAILVVAGGLYAFLFASGIPTRLFARATPSPVISKPGITCFASPTLSAMTKICDFHDSQNEPIGDLDATVDCRFTAQKLVTVTLSVIGAYSFALGNQDLKVEVTGTDWNNNYLDRSDTLSGDYDGWQDHKDQWQLLAHSNSTLIINLSTPSHDFSATSSLKLC